MEKENNILHKDFFKEWVTQMFLVLRLAARHYGLMPNTGNEPRSPSGAGTGAHWAASGWNTPLAAQWADSHTAWREGRKRILRLGMKNKR